MFKVNNRNIRSGIFTVHFEHIFTPFSSVSVVDFDYCKCWLGKLANWQNDQKAVPIVGDSIISGIWEDLLTMNKHKVKVRILRGGAVEDTTDTIKSI